MMKLIYKNEYGAWQEAEKPSEDTIEVADYIKVEFMNSPYYQNKGYSEEAYNSSYSLFEIEKARQYLASTDYVVLQWADEIALGIEHSRSETEYNEILQQRQDAREKIRNIV